MPRHDEIAGARHLVHDAQADGVVRLPEVVPGEAGEHERQRHERQRDGWQRKPERGEGPAGEHRPRQAYFLSAGFLV